MTTSSGGVTYGAQLHCSGKLVVSKRLQKYVPNNVQTNTLVGVAIHKARKFVQELEFNEQVTRISFSIVLEEERNKFNSLIKDNLTKQGNESLLNPLSNI